MKRIALIALLALGACEKGPFAQQPDATVTANAVMETETTAAPPPPTTARTEEAFDTTSAEERAAATAVPEPAGERALGRTIASLGSPTDPGFWLDTPLVSSMQVGRVEAENGKSVQVTLRPIDGPSTAGSRLSLPALRLLEVGLTGLHEVKVYAK